TFDVDNVPLGQAVTNPPFISSWNTKSGADGPHILKASATDAAGNIGYSTPVSVLVDNSRPPNLIGKDATVFVDGQGTMATPSFSTSSAGDLLVAFVGYDGPSNSPQTATVTGA